MAGDAAACQRRSAYPSSCQETYAILGQLGKAIFHIMRFFFLLLIMLAVSGCQNEAADRLQSGQVIGLFGAEGRWAGPVTPTADGCGPTTTGLMTVGRKTFAFDPFQGTTVISGAVSEAALQGTLSRPGNGQQVVSIRFSGTVTDHADGQETIDGKLESGRCSWAVSLKRG
jgi:hypothetical protein